MMKNYQGESKSGYMLLRCFALSEVKSGFDYMSCKGSREMESCQFEYIQSEVKWAPG